MSTIEPVLPADGVAVETPPTLNLSFYLIWIGQSLSMFGSMLTSFAIGVWLFQQSGSVIDYMQLLLYSTVPALLCLPWTGGFADRYDRRAILIGCELLSLLCMVVMGYLLWTDSFQTWQLYVLQVVLAVGVAFQAPAAYATISNLVPKALFGQASGMFGLTTALAQITAPLMAAGLLTAIGLHGIIVLDVLTFVAALIGLMLARFPTGGTLLSESSKTARALAEPMQNLRWAFDYLRARPTLAKVYIYTCIATFLSNIVLILVTPMVLSSYSPAVLARITTAGAVGSLVAGMAMIGWGGPKKWTPWLLALVAVEGLAISIAGYSKSVAVICLCAFAVMASSALLSSCTQIIWRRKVPADGQGRFSGLQQMVSLTLLPLAALVGGLLANYAFEPALLVDGSWADAIGSWFGTGKGRGTGFLFFVIGVIAVVVAVFAVLDRRIYRLESEVEDAM
jgi:MFS transporter, DHA3 family, macrolide efflux protein